MVPIAFSVCTSYMIGTPAVSTRNFVSGEPYTENSKSHSVFRHAAI